VGHKYKTSNPNDRGAAVIGGGWVADYAEDVLVRAKELLEAMEEPQRYLNNLDKTAQT